MPIGAGENTIKKGASTFLIFDDFSGGMNTQADRHNLPEKQLAWLENLQPIAPNRLLGVPGVEPTLATLTGETVVRHFGEVVIGTTNYDIAFCASGAAYAITLVGNGPVRAISGGVVTKIAPAGTFSPTGGDVVVFSAQRILIADTFAGYSTWDGNVFVSQGGVSPNFQVTNGGFGYTNGATATITGIKTTFTVTNMGSGYLNGANVAISGGSGTGMTATALVLNGFVAAVQQQNPGTGYVAGDVLTVTITPVLGGAGALATGAVANIAGTGATASVQTLNGIVTGLTLTAAGTGYTASDILTVTITGVGGVGLGATANAHPWPFISPKPSTIAVAFGRVWLAVARTIIVTGTGSPTFGSGYDDFSPGDASLTTVINDADLINQITALRFLNNYLYIIGDNSVKSVGGISVSQLNTTSFQLVTLSSDQGTLYRNTVISFNRLVVFANTVGVFAVFGASVEKISGPMDTIFKYSDFTSQEPQAAVNDVNNTHVYLLLLRYHDPLKTLRSLILGYASQRWFVMSQGDSITAITTTVLGGITDTLVSSGSDITQILQHPTVAVNFRVSTSLSQQGDPIFAKRIIKAGMAYTSNQCPDVDLIVESEQGQQETNLQHTFRPITWVNNSGQKITWVNNSNQVITWAGLAFTAPHSSEFSLTGRWIGATATGSVNGISIEGIYIEHQPGAAFEIAGASLCTPAVPPPPPPPPPPFVNVPAQWIVGQSCELMSWPLTASGTNPPPTVDIQGTLSTLTGPQGNLKSNTLAADIDTATGQQYVLTQSFLLDNKWDINIPVFAHGATGNIAPIVNITPTNPEFIDSNTELVNAGLCLDANKNIYVGFSSGLNKLAIWSIPAGSSGNVMATLLVTDTTVIITSLAYDAVNNLIWASCLTSVGFHSQARAYTTAGVLQTTITTTAQVTAGQVFIGPSGQIVLSGTDPAVGSTSVTQVFPNGSSGAAVASQTIKITAPQGPTVACGAMDSAGLLYLGPIFDAGGNENINIYAAGVTGTNPATLATFNSTLFVNMLDGTPTDIQQIVVR